MKKTTFIIAIGLICFIGFLLYISKSRVETSPEHLNASSQNVKAEQLQAPAEDQTQLQKEEQSPGVQETPADEVPTVEIPPDKQQLIGVKITEASVKPLQKTIRTVGRVEYDERKLTSVNIKVEGWIEKLYADYSGKYVKKGESLAEIYSPELMSTQLEYMNLLKWKTEKGHRFQRNIEFQWGDRFGTTGQMLTFDIEALLEVAKQRLKLWEIPDDVIKQIEEGGEPPKTLTIFSPSNGYIFQKPVFRGTRVSPGDKIFDVVDLSTVWVIADIYEPDLPLIKVGQQAKITMSYFPDKTFTSKIDFIYPFIAEQTRSAKVRFIVPNPRTVLKPQMFTTVEISVDMGKRLAVPESAVLDSGKRQIVYVDKGEGFFEPREITVGLRTDGMVEILRGLKAGERVASSATFLIDSESKLKGIVQE
jgi:Cu(I)/Ag(I) efflux system membrane fusion protein